MNLVYKKLKSKMAATTKITDKEYIPLHELDDDHLFTEQAICGY